MQARIFRSFAALLAALLLAPAALRADDPGQVTVPEKLTYCGIQLRFTPAARQKLQALVNQYTKNYVYYKLMADKAATYMPFIHDGFEAVGAPKDLAYISIQESGLRGGAVSSANAVGFWQMKSFTAREVGLRVDEQVDERKHIFRASVGAAKYFQKNALRYNNWLYSVISYYEGGTGAKPYTKEEYQGATEMVIDADLHWYALKAIAHRIAYEPGIAAVESPQVKLVPYPTDGETSVEKLAKRHNLTLEKFREHNLWASQASLPADRPISYYVQADFQPTASALADPLRTLFVNPNQPQLALNNTRPAPQPQADTTRQIAAATTQPAHGHHGRGSGMVTEASRDRRFADIRPHVEPAPPVPSNALRYPITKEPQYNLDFAVVREGETIEAIANRVYIPARKLRKWNQLFGDEQPKTGETVMLVRPRRKTIHVSGERQTLVDVAVQHRRNPRRLAYLNRLENPNQLLHPGQKIYLKARRPANQPLHIYFIPDSMVLSEATLRSREAAQRIPAPAAAQRPASQPQARPAAGSPPQARSSSTAAPAQQPAATTPARPATPATTQAQRQSAEQTPAAPATTPVANPAQPIESTTSRPQPAENRAQAAPQPETRPTATPAAQPATRPSTSAQAPAQPAATVTPQPETAAPQAAPMPRPVTAQPSAPVQTREPAMVFEDETPAAPAQPAASRASTPSAQTARPATQPQATTPPQTRPQAQPTAQPQVQEDGFHLVQRGETLYSLARRYSVTVADLKKWNRLTDDNLRTGAKLRIKAPAQP